MPNADTLPANGQRIEYLDYLRVIATAAVVLLHISIQGWGDVDVQSGQWMVYNVWNGLVRWFPKGFPGTLRTRIRWNGRKSSSARI